jgi:hypothetical protein
MDKVSNISACRGSDGVSNATTLNSIGLFCGDFSVMGTSSKLDATSLYRGRK